MKRVYKYELKVKDQQIINLPARAEILKVEMQGESLQLWALVEPSAEPEARHIRIAGTGRPIEEEHLWYINTFFTDNLVFHVFEILREE